MIKPGFKPRQPGSKACALFSFLVFYSCHIFLFFLINFTLQYCLGFAIHWHESATGVHELPILNPLPTSLPISSLWVIRVHSPKHPVSYIEPRLAIRFLHDSIHDSMPFSQIIPPSTSPTESKSLFYTSVSLLLSHIQVYNFFFIYYNAC